MNTFKAIIEPLIPTLSELIASTVLVLGYMLLRKWIKPKVAAELKNLWEELVKGGISYAEQQAHLWAKDRGEPPDSHQKLELASQWIAREADRRGLKSKARDEIEDWIEATLGKGKT